MTQQTKIALFLGRHRGWWCSACINKSAGVGSLIKTREIVHQLAQAKKYYLTAIWAECISCGTTGRKCIQISPASLLYE